MVADIEVYRSANVFIREYGEDAGVRLPLLASYTTAQGPLDQQPVRFRGQSGHPKVTVEISQSECPLLGVKRTFRHDRLNVCL